MIGLQDSLQRAPCHPPNFISHLLAYAQPSLEVQCSAHLRKKKNWSGVVAHL